MDSQSDHLPKTPTARHKCSACYKQYKKKEHLIDHMRVSYHSVHQPKCGVCQKHCKSLESVREHLTGPLPKVDCAKIYNAQGCDLCLNVFDSMEARDANKKLCCMSPPVHPEFTNMPLVQIGAISEVDISGLSLNDDDQRPDVVALDCEMVGGGSDGSLDLCGRVCIIDEDENVIFHAYVQPQIPITNYRYMSTCSAHCIYVVLQGFCRDSAGIEFYTIFISFLFAILSTYRSELTGMTEDQFKYALSLKQVKEKIQEILYNGESIWKLRMEGGKARILVGHDLEHDLGCLLMHYPDHLMRDTAKYRPLMKTNLISHSLKYLTRTYLGYDIQTGVHDPYDDCVAAMRLYKRFRDQVHPPEAILTSMVSQHSNIFDGWKAKELEKMSPDELLEISRSDYRCWCLDSRKSLTS